MLQVEKDAEQLHEQEFEIERLQTEVVELRARLDDAIAGSEDSAAALSDQSAAIKAKNNKLLALSNKLKEMQQAAVSSALTDMPGASGQERSSDCARSITAAGSGPGPELKLWTTGPSFRSGRSALLAAGRSAGKSSSHTLGWAACAAAMDDAREREI